MRTLAVEFKLSFDRYLQAPTQDNLEQIRKLMNLYLQQKAFLAENGLFVEDSFYNFFFVPHELDFGSHIETFNSELHSVVFRSLTKEIDQYTALIDHAAKRMLPLHPLQKLIDDCLDSNNIYRFQKLLPIILQVETAYNAEQTSFFPLLDFAKKMLNNRVISIFFESFLQVFDKLLLQSEPNYKEMLLEHLFQQCEALKLNVRTLENLEKLFAYPVSFPTEPGKPTYLERFMLLVLEQKEQGFNQHLTNVTHAVMRTLMQARADTNTWHDDCYAAIAYTIQWMQQQREPESILIGQKIIARFVNLRKATEMQLTDSRFIFKKMDANEDELPVDVTGIFLSVCLLFSIEGSSLELPPLPENHNEGNAKIIRPMNPGEFLDRLFPVIYAIYSFTRGVQFPGDLYESLLQKALERPDLKFVDDIIGRNNGFKGYIPLAIENVRQCEAHERVRRVDPLIFAHTIYEPMRPLSDFAGLFNELEQTTESGNVVYFYEKLISARGFDEKLKPHNWPTPFIKGFGKEARLNQWASVNFNFHNAHLNKNNLVDTFSPYLNSKEQFLFDSDAYFSKLNSVLEDIEKLPQSFVIEDKQRKVIKIAGYLNTILNEFTRSNAKRFLNQIKRMTLSSEESSVIVANAFDQLLLTEVKSTQQVMHDFFEELVIRMLAKPEPLILTPAVWQGLREGFLNAVERLPESERKKAGYQAMLKTVEFLKDMKHPSPETYKPTPKPLEASSSSSSSSSSNSSSASSATSYFASSRTTNLFGQFFPATTNAEVELADMGSAAEEEKQNGHGLDHWLDTQGDASPLFGVPDADVIQLTDDSSTNNDDDDDNNDYYREGKKALGKK